MDKVLKQRLVGASILIALAVIFLPMLFDSGGNDGVEERELALDLPERQSGDRQVRRLPLDPEQARTPPDESQSEPPRETRPEPPVREPRPVEEEQAEVARPEPESPASEGGPEGETDPAPSEPAEPDSGGEQDEAAESEADPVEPDAERDTDPAPAATADGNWVVQVAVFSSRDTANSIRQRLDDLGHRVSMDVLIRDQAELFRLRAGPYASEDAAEQARGQIAATVTGVDPVTRELSGGGNAEDRSGMAVQVGSFASRNNAERLVGQLTEAGFDAFMYGEETGGRTIWRVRVGAYEERADAERLLETLRNERGLEGIVVSHP